MATSLCKLPAAAKVAVERPFSSVPRQQQLRLLSTGRRIARSTAGTTTTTTAGPQRPGGRSSRVRGMRAHVATVTGKREQITVKEAMARISQLYEAEPTGAACQLIDVREPDEISTANLGKHGWKWTVLPLNSKFEEWQAPLRAGKMLDRTLPTFVLCHHGMRSDFVCRFLSEHCGFEEVYNILGGINVWSDIDEDIPKY